MKLPAKLEHLGRVFDSITVDRDNLVFEFEDSALYNNLEKKLIWFSKDRMGTSFTAREGTETICRCGNAYTMSVMLPDSVRTIESEAFSGCGRLCYVELNEGLTSIQYRAFAGCYDLSEINLPSTLTFIGAEAFSDTVVREITIPAGLFAKEGDEAGIRYQLRSLGQLEYVYVAPNHPLFSSKGGVLFNKDGTELLFYPMARLDTSYTVPVGTRVIGEEALARTQLEEVALPATLERIEWNAFSKTNIEELEIPEGTRVVYGQDFLNALTKLVIPASVIDLGAHWNCPNTTPTVYGVKGTLAEKLAENKSWPFVEAASKISGLALNAKSVTLYTGEYSGVLTAQIAPDTAEKAALSWKAEDPLIAQLWEINGNKLRFYAGKPGTTTITVSASDNPSVKASVKVTVKPLSEAPNAAVLPSGLKTIDNSAFKGTAYQYVYIPDGVRTIEARAFMDCANLKVVRIPSSVTHIAPDAFADCGALIIYTDEGNNEIFNLREEDSYTVIFGNYARPANHAGSLG